MGASRTVKRGRAPCRRHPKGARLSPANVFPKGLEMTVLHHALTPFRPDDYSPAMRPTGTRVRRLWHFLTDRPLV